MSERPQLTAEAEAGWRIFLRHLEWAEGFTLLILFVVDTRAADLYRERLDAIYRMRVARLDRLSPQSPGALAGEILPRLLRPDPLLQEAAAPVWVELYHGRSPEWTRARENLLARVNEHRELLRTRLRRPVILALPGSDSGRFREVAPDLWSVRSFVDTLDAPTWRRRAASPPEEPWPQPYRRDGIQVEDDPALREWRRLRARRALGPDVLRAGWRAVSSALRQGNLGVAEEVARDVAELARSASMTEPEDRRALSVSLGQVGDVARAGGDLEGARHIFGDLVSVLRRLAWAFPEDADTARRLQMVEEAQRDMEMRV